MTPQNRRDTDFGKLSRPLHHMITAYSTHMNEMSMSFPYSIHLMFQNARSHGLANLKKAKASRLSGLRLRVRVQALGRVRHAPFQSMVWVDTLDPKP